MCEFHFTPTETQTISCQSVKEAALTFVRENRTQHLPPHPPAPLPKRNRRSPLLPPHPRMPIQTDGAGNNGTSIEIKVKTMDSQTYTLQVDKQVPVPTLKDQIATVTGVVKEHQRLICRGRVLKDDQLLSAYHVEDGHTLHLVVREPPPSSMENLPNDSAFDMPTGGRTEYYQVAPGVMVEAFNINGERSLPDIGRIVSAVLGSIGIAGPGSVGEGIGLRENGPESLGRVHVRGDATHTNQPQPEQPGSRNQSDRLRPHNAFGVGTAFPFGAAQAPVIPDAISTLSDYLINMQREFSSSTGEAEAWISAAIADGHTQPANAMDVEQTEAGSVPSENSQVLPTPGNLAELLLSTRELLDQPTGECLIQVARQVLRQASVSDPDARSSAAQSSVWRSGVLLQNLGAYLLELGRTIMTIRLGRSPSETVINAGPAVFISSSGPNPLMVQPLPFQPGASFGAPPPTASSGVGAGSSHGFGSGLLPRRIDIHIRRGSMARQQETDGTQQQPLAQQVSSTGVTAEAVHNEPVSATSNNPSLPGGPNVRALPIRTIIGGAIPAIPDLNHIPTDTSGNSPGLYFPLFGRIPSTPSRNTSSRTGSQLSSEHPISGLHSEQPLFPEAATQQQNIGNPPRNENERPPTRTIDISIFSSGVGGGVGQGEETPEGQPPESVVQLLRGLFPGSEVQVDSSQRAAAVTGNRTRVSTAVPEAESRPTQDGIFLSGLLHQIMPLISQPEQNDAGPSSTPAADSEAGTSGRQGDPKLDEPSPKRHKME